MLLAHAGGMAVGTIEGDVQIGSLRLDEMEERIMAENVEMMKLRREIQRLQLRLSEAQEKYSELLTAKTELSATVLDSEEERLAVSKALLDLKIENTQIRETTEAQVFEQTNRILMLEKKLLESKQISDQAVKDMERTNAQMAHLKDTEDELQSLRRSHQTVREQLSAEKMKTQELGLEVLSLANGRKALMQEIEDLSTQLKRKIQTPITTSATVPLLKVQTPPNKAHTSSSKLSDVDPQKSAFPLGPNIGGLQKLQEDKNELERRMIEQAEEHISLVQRINEQHAAELNELRDQLREQTDLAMNMKMSSNDVARGVASARAEARTASAKVEALVSENARLNTAYNRQLGEYRNRLGGYIRDIQNYIAQSNGKTTPESASRLKRYIDQMLKDLTISYAAREKELLDELSSSFESLQAAQKKQRILQKAYQACAVQMQQAGMQPTALTDIKVVDADSEELVLEMQQNSIERNTSASSTKSQRIATNESTGARPQSADATSPSAIFANADMDMASLRRTLTQFITSTQRSLEEERADLIVRCNMAEEKAKKLQEYVETNLTRYQKEIHKLRTQLGNR